MKNRIRSNKNKRIILLSFVLLISLLTILNLKNIIQWDFNEVIYLIEGKLLFSSSIYLLLFFVKPFLVFVPTNIMAIAAGTVFGPILGFILTMFGFFISGTISFYLARFLGGDVVKSIVGKKSINLNNSIDENGFKILLLLRLPPIIPYDILSYASGLTKISYKDFIIASLMGVAPETICFSIAGQLFENPVFLKIAIIVLPVIVAAILLKNKKIKQEL